MMQEEGSTIDLSYITNFVNKLLSSGSSTKKEEDEEDEQDEDEVALRLPSTVATLGDKDFSFPADDVEIVKVLATPGQFSRIILGKYKGEEVVVKEIQVEDQVYAYTEIAFLRHMRCPHILRLIGAAKIKDENGRLLGLVAVTEFMKGGNLGEALEARKPNMFGWEKRVRAALHGIRAIEYMHKHGVIHRDIKSENILLSSREDEDFIAKLCDFGFARGISKQEKQEGIHVKGYVPKPKRSKRSLKGHHQEVRGHERAQTVCGTDEYMSPEMMLGSFDSPYTTSVDIFSFGCVLIELCAGQLLRRGFIERLPQNGFAFDDNHIRQVVQNECPLSLVELAICCVNPEPEQRPTPIEVREWLEDLTTDLKSHPDKVERIIWPRKSRLKKKSKNTNPVMMATLEYQPPKTESLQNQETPSAPPPQSCCIVQ